MNQPAAEAMVPQPRWAMISITGFNPYTSNNEADLHPDWAAVLRLEFDDVAIRGDHLHGISEDQARQIIEFLNAVQDKADKIVVHCLAGVSRSAGVAKFIADTYGLDFDDGYDFFNRLVYETLKEVDAKVRCAEAG
jgi:predicted protein tyrosine phosphatase